MERKVHANLITTDHGTGFVTIDKIDDVPMDLTAHLLVEGHVCSRSVGPPKPATDANKAKRIIFTPDKDSDMIQQPEQR